MDDDGGVIDCVNTFCWRTSRTAIVFEPRPGNAGSAVIVSIFDIIDATVVGRRSLLIVKCAQYPDGLKIKGPWLYEILKAIESLIRRFNIELRVGILEVSGGSAHCDGDCPICMESFDCCEESAKPRVLVKMICCGAIMHRECAVDVWVRLSMQCPMCRSKACPFCQGRKDC